jgi:hypothetical protein
MKGKTSTVLLLFGAVLAGCASGGTTSGWTKSGGTQVQHDMDMQQCRAEALRDTASMGAGMGSLETSGAGAGASRRASTLEGDRRHVNDCLQRKGYKYSPQDAG